MTLGTVAWIRRYPVKSLRSELVPSAVIAETGIEGDRVRRLVVTAGHARLGKAYRGKENQRLHLAEDVGAALSEASARGVTASVEQGEHFFDDGAVSIVVDRWLDGVSEALGYDVGPERFRPNFFVRADAGFESSERDITGATLAIGEALLRVQKPIPRCVAVTYDPQRDAPDPRILRYVAQERDGDMGVYCEVLRTGTARIGDSVAIVER